MKMREKKRREFPSIIHLIRWREKVREGLSFLDSGNMAHQKWAISILKLSSLVLLVPKVNKPLLWPKKKFKRLKHLKVHKSLRFEFIKCLFDMVSIC